MNIWNKVLLGLIAVALLPLVYFSLVALKTHQHWRSVATKIEAKLPPLAEEIHTIEFGKPQQENADSLQSIRIEQYKYYVDQGKIWRNCVLQGQAGNEVKVALAKPDPAGIAPYMVLYAFDEAPIAEGGCYLGEFKVNAIDKASGALTLEPTMRLLPKAIDRIKSGKGNWTLCEVMPNDMHEPFAGLEKNDRLRTSLPAAVVDEYLADGRNDQVRQLRDYYVLLKEIDRQETVLLEDLEATTRHEQYMQAAAADAKKQELFQQDERTALTAELNRMQTERGAALAHEQALRNELKQLEAKIAQLIEDNRAVAANIAQMQAKMLRQVDRRSAVAAKP